MSGRNDDGLLGATVTVGSGSTTGSITAAATTRGAVEMGGGVRLVAVPGEEMRGGGAATTGCWPTGAGQDCSGRCSAGVGAGARVAAAGDGVTAGGPVTGDAGDVAAGGPATGGAAGGATGGPAGGVAPVAARGTRTVAGGGVRFVAVGGRGVVRLAGGVSPFFPLEATYPPELTRS